MVAQQLQVRKHQSTRSNLLESKQLEANCASACLVTCRDNLPGKASTKHNCTMPVQLEQLDDHCPQQPTHNGDSPNSLSPGEQSMLGHPLSLLKEEKPNVEVILETIHEDINMERPDLRTSLPELRNRGKGLMDTYMNSIKSQVDSLSNHRSEYASVARVLLQEADDMVDSYNEMIRRSNTALMNNEWYEETTTADPGDASEQPAAKMRHIIPPPNTDLKVKCVKHELHDVADY